MATKKRSTKKAAKSAMTRIGEAIGTVAGEISVKKDELVEITSHAIDNVKEKIHNLTAPQKSAVKKAVKKVAKKATVKKIKKAISKKAAPAKKAVKNIVKKATAVKKAVKKSIKKAAGKRK